MTRGAGTRPDLVVVVVVVVVAVVVVVVVVCLFVCVFEFRLCFRSFPHRVSGFFFLRLVGLKGSRGPTWIAARYQLSAGRLVFISMYKVWLPENSFKRAWMSHL